ncbi:MAG TPA: glycosyltransferase [Chthoniobacterales bacterium]|nr:glycosyltransferase [Chthoniobacterales bacterium]
MNSMTLSIMITTRNRVENLQRTLRVLTQLDPAPDEILITTDGCVDGTEEFVRSELPTAKLVVNNRVIGSVASRDRMMREARGDLVLALDDDSYPEELDCISRIVPFFEQRPRLAVLNFPQRTDEYFETLTQTNFGSEHLTRSFANSGAALRRATYLQLAGFESRFFHMYEEPDYGLQCVAAGYDVLCSPVVTIRHHYSGQARDEMRIHHRHARNEFWSTLIRCPLPFAVGMVAWRVFSQFRYARKRGWSWVVREPVWWCEALAGIPYCVRKRRPVPWAGYKRWLSLP